MTSNIYLAKDSVSAKFQKSALSQKRGAGGTHTRMKSTFNALETVAKRWGKDFSPETMTAKQFATFVKTRLDAGVSARTVQVEAGHIRRSLRALGRDDFADRVCSNSALEVPAGSRVGKGTAIDPAVFELAIENAPRNVRASLLLADCLGLRIKESTRCEKNLPQWEKALERGQALYISCGTGSKGDRPRALILCPANVERAKAAVAEARSCIREQQRQHPGDKKYDYLIPSTSLDGARVSLKRSLTKLGIKGADSHHSLRRDFCVNEFKYMTQELGLSRAEACARIVVSMGHGDHRGDLAWNSYIRPTLQAEARAQEAAS